MSRCDYQIQYSCRGHQARGPAPTGTPERVRKGLPGVPEARHRRQAQRLLKKLRLRRDNEQKPLYGLLIRVRGIFEDAFGQVTAVVYLGLESKIHKLEPIALRHLAQETVNILTDPGLSLPEPKVQGLWENPAQYAEQILELLEPFQASLDEIESQKREVEKAQKEKVELLAKVGERLTWSIRLFEAVYQLADLGFQAERLRLTVSSRPRAGDSSSNRQEGRCPVTLRRRRKGRSSAR